MTRKNFLTLITVILLLSFTACAFAATKKKINLGEGYNAPSGFKSILITSSDGTAIQNAVDNIQAGGTILLSGDFKLQKMINIKKNLNIRGIGNTVLTYSNPSEPDRILRCEGDITLQNLIITGGSSTNGGGVKVDGGKVNIISCDIHGNTGLAGGGIHASQANTLTLTSCDISNNHATMAGGGMTVLGGTITVNNCSFTSNDAALYGGGLGSAGGNITLNSSKFTKNSSQNGGGVAIILASKLTARSCDISYNIRTASKDMFGNPTYSNVFWDSTSTHTFDAYTEDSVNK